MRFKTLLVLVAVGAVVAIVIIKTRKNEFDKIEAAIPGWLGQGGCASIKIVKPSSDTGFTGWVGPSADTATISCEYLGGYLDYAKFSSSAALNRALHSRPIPERICVAAHTVLMNALMDESEGPGRFTKTCKSLHGILYRGDPSQIIVDPTKVPDQLARTDLHIVYRRGPRPAGFVRAIYGTASNSRRKSIHFGFFFTNNAHTAISAGSHLKQLVPDATEEGSASGHSYVEVTNAGGHGGPHSLRTQEELRIAHELRRAVAKLAPRAMDGETFE